jgi:hypothetical protein
MRLVDGRERRPRAALELVTTKQRPVPSPRYVFDSPTSSSAASAGPGITRKTP